MPQRRWCFHGNSTEAKRLRHVVLLQNEQLGNGRTDREMEKNSDERTYDGWLDRRKSGWVGGWVDGWVGGLMGRWMGGWIDGWVGSFRGFPTRMVHLYSDI